MTNTTATLHRTPGLLLLLAGLFFSAQSLAFVIDFEDVTAGVKSDPFVINVAPGLTATFSATDLAGNPGFPDFSVYNTAVSGPDPDLLSPFYDAAQRGSGTFLPKELGNIGIINTENADPPNDRARGGIITVEFNKIVTLIDMLVVDASLTRGGPVLMEMFNAANAKIEAQTKFNADTSSWPNYYELVDLKGTTGVTTLKITMGINGGVSGGIDEIRGTFTEETPGIPAPGTLLLLTAALPLAAYRRARRQRNTA